MTAAISLLLPAATGCRELVQPQAPAKLSSYAAGIVATADGRLLKDVTVVLDNRSIVPSGQWVSWRGVTNARGEFLSDVPAGQYFDVDVEYPSSSLLPHWEFNNVWFGDTPVSLQPEPLYQPGRVHLPPAFPSPIVDGSGTFEYRLWRPSGGWRFLYSSFYTMGAAGEFEVTLPAPARYRLGTIAVRTATARLEFTMADSVSTSAPDTLHLTPELVQVTVHTTVGAAPDTKVALTLSLTTLDQSGRVDRSRFFVEADSEFPVRGWALERAARLLITPRSGAPFMSTSIPILPVSDGTWTIDLGRHRLDVQVVSAAGSPVAGAQVTITYVVEQYSDLDVDVNTNTGGLASCFLNTGPYRVLASLSSTVYADTVVTVDSDTSIQLRLPPPPSP